MHINLFHLLDIWSRVSVIFNWRIQLKIFNVSAFDKAREMKLFLRAKHFTRAPAERMLKQYPFSSSTYISHEAEKNNMHFIYTSCVEQQCSLGKQHVCYYKRNSRHPTTSNILHSVDAFVINGVRVLLISLFVSSFCFKLCFVAAKSCLDITNIYNDP